MKIDFYCLSLSEGAAVLLLIIFLTVHGGVCRDLLVFYGFLNYLISFF